MGRTVKPSRLSETLAELDDPVDRGAVAEQFADVTLSLADGTATLGEVIADSGDDRSESVDDLDSDVTSNLPCNAVGEPSQSEGDG